MTNLFDYGTEPAAVAVGCTVPGDLTEGDVMVEVVRTWNCGITGKYHAALSPDFDPATDEVIVVKKDAARVWVEGYSNSEVLHGEHPQWDGSTWYSKRYGYVNDCIGGKKMASVDPSDLVEFIAIKTHRPPVEHEAKLPEPVAELASPTDSILPLGCSTEIVSAPVPSAGQGVATCS